MTKISIKIQGEGVEWRWSAATQDVAGFAALGKVLAGRLNPSSGRASALALIERALMAARASLSDEPTDALAAAAGRPLPVRPARVPVTMGGEKIGEVEAVKETDHGLEIKARFNEGGSVYSFAPKIDLGEIMDPAERVRRADGSVSDYLSGRPSAKPPYMNEQERREARSPFGPVQAGLVTPVGKADPKDDELPEKKFIEDEPADWTENDN